MKALRVPGLMCALVAVACSSDSGDGDCVPVTCGEAGAQCGGIADGCGAFISCGSCTAPDTCGAGGVENVCGCEPETDADFCLDAGADCDLFTGTDRCGLSRTADCGTCPMGRTCGGSGEANVCGCDSADDAVLCMMQGKDCGQITIFDCSAFRTAQCGTCQQPQTCGGTGEDNVCGCPPENDASFCARYGKDCGSYTDLDNCGAMRTADCGNCTGNDSCGGGGISNVCGCRPACGNLCAGPDGCGGSCVDACRAPTSCGAGGVSGECGCTAMVETDPQLCTRHGKDCGDADLPDTCGVSRAVNCGTCGMGDVCGAGGANVCGTVQCNAQGWCWDSPLPQGNNLRAVFARTPTDVWAVGDLGTALHFDGTGWSGEQLGNGAIDDPSLTAVWAAATGDVWVTGQVRNAMGQTSARLFHYDGMTWTETDPGVTQRLNALWGSGPTDVWAVGNGGRILRYDGTWTDWPGPTPLNLHGIWGSSANQVWAVGQAGALLRFTGIDWIEQTRLTTGTLTAITGAGANDVWAVGTSGNAGIILRYDGIRWRVDGDGALDGLVAGLLSAWARGPNDLWAASRDTLFHWTRLGPRTTPWGGDSLLAMGGAGADDAWAVGEFGEMARWRGAVWTPATGGRRDDWNAVAGLGGSEVWIAGGADLDPSGVSYDGTTYADTPVQMSMTDLDDVEAVWPVASGDVWGVGLQGTILNYDGMAWVPFASGSVADLNGVWAGGGGAVYAVGSAGTILQYDGMAWMPFDIGMSLSDDLTAIWGSGSEIFIAGNGPTLLRYDGMTWQLESCGSASQWRGLWGSSPTDVWVVGDGEPCRFNGTTWSEVPRPVPNSGPLFSVGGTGQNDVWAVGAWGQAWRFDGGAWTRSQTGSERFLWGTWSAGVNRLWAVASEGTILRKQP